MSQIMFAGCLVCWLKERDQWLSPIVPVVPARDMVINELKKYLRSILSDEG